MTLCQVEGCIRAAHRRGWCSSHYKRWIRHGDPSGGGIARPRVTFQERFWSKVTKTDTCWLWAAASERNGYGAIREPGTGRMLYAHRLAYEWLVGPIPEGLHIDHLCNVRRCVNPSHLEAVTQQENNVRSWARRTAKREIAA